MRARHSFHSDTGTNRQIAVQVIALLAIVIQVVGIVWLLGPGEHVWDHSAGISRTAGVGVVMSSSTPSPGQSRPTRQPGMLLDPVATPTPTEIVVPTPRSTDAVPKVSVTAASTMSQSTATPTEQIQQSTVTSSPTVMQLIERVIATEAMLHSGELEATIDYGNGSGPSVRLIYDLGDRDHPARMHLVSTYPSEGGSQTVERIVIGDQAWQRTAGGDWLEVAEQEGVWGQVQGYLPRIARASERYPVTSPALDTVIWHDTVRQVAVTLRVDSEAGVPITMEQHGRSTGTVTTVTYISWNQPVVIQPPTGG